MTSASDMLNAASEVSMTPEKEAMKSLKKIERNYKSLCQAFQEIIFSNQKVFDKIYIGTYKDNIKLKVISEYLEVNKDQITCSPMSSDVEEFTISYMIYEGLAEIFESTKHAYSLSMNEFLFFWITLQRKGFLYTCLADYKNKEVFTDSFRSTLEKKTTNSFIDSMLSSMKSKDFEDDEDGLDEDDGESFH